MSQVRAEPDDRAGALAFQHEILPEVSRTFALTIPELPEPLRRAVGNAYLLCRIADTIEDDAGLSTDDKAQLHAAFTRVVETGEGAAAFGEMLAGRLSSRTPASERRLVAHTGQVTAVTRSLGQPEQAAIARCVRGMCDGMPMFERNASRGGLPTLAHLDRYCYFVAGVVGEMLSALFCEVDGEIAAQRPELERLAVSFGQGLQMTNILKDIWEDYNRGVCWLPRDVFAAHGFDLDRLDGLRRTGGDHAFEAGLTELIGLAHGHLRNALEFTLRIPGEHKGIRRFCLWAIGLALLTLRKIRSNPGFSAGDQVKVSRRSVQATVLTTNLAIADDDRLRQLFHMTAGDLPALTPALAADPAAPVDDRPAARAPERPLEVPAPAGVTAAIDAARERLLADQNPDGHWRYECEADCTIPAEYILMMHFVGDIDAGVQARIARYLRHKQCAHGGWPLYYGGDLDVSCSVKAYYALKLAGDDPEEPHMVHAREAILARGGAGRVNVFTLIALAQYGQVPWRAVPFIPVEVMLLPEASPFHLSKVSYWSRTVMVPLFILTSQRTMAKNPQGVNVRELFTIAPEAQRDFIPAHSLTGRFFKGLDAIGRSVEPLIPGMVRKLAIQRAERWIIERLNDKHGIGAIFPAMINVYEALGELGYAKSHAYRTNTRQAIDDLIFDHGDMASVQPCVSPVWDTGLASLALQAADDDNAASVRAGLDWLAARQVLDAPGDWRDQHPDLDGGGWPFQYANDHYPDLDDTAMIAWAMHNTGDGATYGHAITRAANWLAGMQSANGGVAAFDSDNNHEYLNEIPFADHGALLDPPSADVTARVLTLLGHLDRPGDAPVVARALDYLKREQEADGSWYGRWGTNYIYGTWSVLVALNAIGEDMHQPWIARAVTWLKGMQRSDGGWGEDNGNYWQPPRGRYDVTTSFQTAWAMLGLMAAGECDTPALHAGAGWLIAAQGDDGAWHDPDHTAPGFPRVFYLKYHGYTRYFPLWALARYRNLHNVA